ncbi:MAG TPA: hypothetical protein VHL98_22125 [Microvirga sp.]|jgi:hypothetical protein|nr:hypothetical protein [Microvirga sp.]
MHYRDLSPKATPIQPALNYHNAARFIIEQQFAPNGPATSMPHLVDCPDLVPSRFKTPAEYHRAVALRTEWCSRYAYGGHSVQALDGDAEQNGLRFRFTVGPVATLFNLMNTAWGTRFSKGQM